MPLNRLVAPLAAAALLLGVPQIATAATLSVDIPGCSQVALSGSGSNYTITCTQAAMTCVAQSSPVSPSGGTTAALTVACSPAATAVVWSGSRDCATPSPGGGVGQANVTEALGGRSCVYTAAATAPGYSGSASVAVVWQGSSTAVPPSGCTVTRTPASGSLGTNGGAVSMSAACTAGGSVTSWSWRKGTTTGWSSNQSANDTLPANTGSAAVTHTYAVTACSNGACAPEVVTTFTVAGSAPAGFCGQYSDVRFVDLNWGSPPVDTYGGVGLVPGTLIVGRLTVPANATSPANQPGVISIVEYQGSPIERVLTLSTQPCDFRGWTPGQNFPGGDQSGANSPMGWAGGLYPNLQFLLQGDPAGFPAKPLLLPGQTYYFNLQTIRFNDGQNSCTQSSCDVRMTVNPPT
jgi:hypothetical protein